MKFDSAIRSDVEGALVWEPSVTSTPVGVAAENGVVALSCHVPAWTEKWKAERAAKRVLQVDNQLSVSY